MRYSFLVAIYNVERYLKRCIDSILSQDFPKSEYDVLLVDDGSTDRSGCICDDYSDQFQNVRTIHQENQGLLHARKTGVVHAKGQYLVFVDGDDYIEKTLLSSVEKYLSKSDTDVLIFSYYKNYENRQISNVVTKNGSELLDKEELMRRFLSSDDYNSIWQKVVKADLLKNHVEEIYQSRSNIGEDKLQTVYLIKYADSFLLVDSCLYHYCIRDDSMVHVKTKQSIYDVIGIYERVERVSVEIMNNLHLEEQVQKALLFWYRSAALEGTMEHIYKLNRQDTMDRVEKMNNLKEIYRDNEPFFAEKEECRGIKKYNRLRYQMFMNGHYQSLITLDTFLWKVQKMKRSFG